MSPNLNWAGPYDGLIYQISPILNSQDGPNKSKSRSGNSNGRAGYIFCV